MTFRRKWPIFEELVAVFSNIIQQKRVLEAGQLFPSLTGPLFVAKFSVLKFSSIGGKVVFSTKFGF